MDQQVVRSRQRVSRACERCRIKKAKCDGERPCRRCKLDKAPCSYKIRRTTKCANQRYTNLLLQHQEALTVGVVELYKRLVRGQKWDGGPIEKVNGKPSADSILERLGVLDHDKDTCNPDLCLINQRSEPIHPMSLTRPITQTTTPKRQRAVRPGKRAEPACPAPMTVLLEQQSFFVHSPKLATAATMNQSSTAYGPPSSALDEDKVSVQSTYFPQLPSALSPVSDARSMSLSNCLAGRLNTGIARTSWVDAAVDVFYDELFSTPMPKEAQRRQQYPDLQMEALFQAQTQGQTWPIHQNPYAMLPSYGPPNLSVTEAYNAE